MKRYITMLGLAVLLAPPLVRADLNTGLGALERSDYSTALRDLRPLAENGNPQAQFNLGKMYAYGWGVKKNELEAAAWYRKAAEQGDPRAQKMLAALCEKGVGMEQYAAEVKPQDAQAAVRIASEGRVMCLAAAQKLEARLKSNPNQLSARIRLLSYYFFNGIRDVGVKATLEARRRHVFWLIQQQPEAVILSLSEASIDPAGHALADADAYAEGKRLWLAQADKPNAAPLVYLNGARYLQLHDKPQAEALLQKGKAAYPGDRSWSASLGYLYALGILGVTGLNHTGIPTAASPAEAASPFALHARGELEKSGDPLLIGTAGAILSQYGIMLAAFGQSRSDESSAAEKLLARAQQLEPNNPYWSQVLAEHLMMQVKRTPANARSQDLLKRALAQMERSLGQTTDQEWRMGRLDELAKLAYQAGDFQKAEKYAGDLLALAGPQPTDARYGQAWHDGHVVLGRLALRRGDVAAAKADLLKAGRTPGGGTLSSFGPNMSLAQDMLKRGERATVIEYLQLCKVFWSYPRNPLDRWIAEIKSGRSPEFGANLDY